VFSLISDHSRFSYDTGRRTTDPILLATQLVLVTATSSKSRRFRRFKSDRGEIRQDCYSSK